MPYMNKQLLDAYNQINLTISDFGMCQCNNPESDIYIRAALADVRKAERKVEKAMQLEGMKIPE